MGEKYKQQILSVETIVRQKDTKIELWEIQLIGQKENKNQPRITIDKEVDEQKTDDKQHDPLQHNWPGISPGPEIMQNKNRAYSK